MTLDDLLCEMAQKEASDLHLKVGKPPMIRLHGDIIPMNDESLGATDIRELLDPVVPSEGKAKFEKERELDFAHSISGVARFRFNILLQKHNVGVVIRRIPLKILSLEELNAPPVLAKLALKEKGLVLVTGPTGSGKSTTLAALINHINENRKAHILTIEDPIEFVHPDKQSIINQREVGADTLSFDAALKHVLRQDPDVILVGEMRNLETIATTITAAETGHMVFATLHTTGAIATIDRVIDAFPPEHQNQIRNQLSMVLEGVVSQNLLPKIGGGRVAVQEIMVCNSAIRNLIREAKLHQISTIIQTGGSQGMIAFDTALKNLVQSKQITPEDALAKALCPDVLKNTLANLGFRAEIPEH
ncbi:MAG: type IV pilus twitching motility protein PilT [bacterium]